MGNKQTKPVEKQAFNSSHPLYKNAGVIKEGGKNYIQARLPVQVKEYDAWKDIVLDTKNPLNHQFLLLPEHTGFQHDKELCGNTGTAINNYPYFPINLADQINKRKTDQTFFKQSELWYLLFALVAAKIDLRKHGYRLGDIKPENVFIDEERRIKIVNILTSSNEKYAYDKAKDFENASLNVLLAPQDFPQLAKNSIDNKSNLQSQVFAIGATVISAGLLDELRSIYNYKKIQFIHEELNTRKEKWTEHPKYSQIFKSIILNLVNEDPSKRISIEDLFKFCSKYENSIKAKEQFIITHPPENLQSAVSIVRSKVH